jgi:curved DNA-binding protein CbpA
MISERTLYDDLEVSEAASPETIRAAYQSLMKRFHPDRNQGDDSALQRSQQINAAYRVLSSPDLKKQYDESLMATRGNPRQESRASDMAGTRQSGENGNRTQSSYQGMRDASMAAEAYKEARKKKAFDAASSAAPSSSEVEPEREATRSPLATIFCALCSLLVASFTLANRTPEWLPNAALQMVFGGLWGWFIAAYLVGLVRRTGGPFKFIWKSLLLIVIVIAVMGVIGTR